MRTWSPALWRDLLLPPSLSSSVLVLTRASTASNPYRSDNLLHVIFEPNLQHLIRLIEHLLQVMQVEFLRKAHQKLDSIQPQRTSRLQVQDPNPSTLRAMQSARNDGQELGWVEKKMIGEWRRCLERRGVDLPGVPITTSMPSLSAICCCRIGAPPYTL